ncbi:hypothetical protein [Streptomyces sp. BE147]|uniref:hypothetical protein n=1 Tax=unclassified Streptomyces TaxID=2593676 RepID=UPI002E79A27B|nr:hypothetical protein [Streptomyces sp. BE147]MEE1735850.1 hypothetical protein [Streptomyces sp. BE147]
MSADGESAPEAVWLVAANVVRWRRYGDLGQELRPGTKAYRGGTKVYVIGTHPGTGHQQLTTVGRGRHTRRFITIDTGTRHLHTFRAQLVYSPAVLARAGSTGTPTGTQEGAKELAALLERIAREERHAHHAAPHPVPCRCHECLTAAEAQETGRVAEAGADGDAGRVSPG